jgi:hypothetical protein
MVSISGMRELREFAIVASCFVIVIGAASAMSSGCGGSDTGQGGAAGAGGTPSSLPSTGGNNTNNGGSSSPNGTGGTVFAGTGGSPAGTGGANAGGSNTGGSNTGGANAGGGGASSSSAVSASASSVSASSAVSVSASSVAASSSVSVSASSVAASSSSTGGGGSLTVWINELHYANVGVDSGEGVEVAGVANTDLTGFKIVLYKSDGTVGPTISLSGTIPAQSNGFGTKNFPHDGIPNGPSDGLALVDSTSHVLQFLSYQGTVLATAGAASGMTSTDIGVAESDSTTPAGQSLQLTGAGHTYSDFTWAPPALATVGMINNGQTFP